MTQKAKYQSLSKLEKYNVRQKLLSEYGSGKLFIGDLAHKYNVIRRVALRWKIKQFGKGSLREKLIYQMHQSQIPSKTIAEFYNVHVVQVNKSIRTHAKKINDLKNEYTSVI